MAKTGYLDLDTAQEQAYFGALTSGDRFINACVQRKVSLLSRRRRKGVSQKSLLPACSLAWSTLSTEEKALWSTAGSYCNLNGWRTFVRDYVYRVVNEIEGIATPSNFHQGLVGQIQIDSPADEIKIFQPHPSAYFIALKVVGTKNMYSPIEITERLILPLTIGLSYKSNLVKTEVDGFAKFYAVVRRLYQGRNLDEILEINLDLSADWKTSEATLSSILGQYTSYALYFHLYHVTGTLLFDNIKATHSGQNWTRDPSCQDIHQDFTRAFYQVPKHWSAITIPEGAFFESVYPI